MTPDQLHKLYAYSSDVEQAIKKMETMLAKPNRSIIGLTGGPGSGKSTLSNYLYSRMKDLHPNQVACISMDGFHLSKQALTLLPNSAEALARRGAPWTFDSERFIEHTKQLKNGFLQQDTLWPSFDHSLGDPIENDIIISKNVKLVLIEGLYLLHQEDGWQDAIHLIDQHWFLDTPLELAFERLAQRHMKAWGYTYEQAMTRIQHSDSLNAKTVFACKPSADWQLIV